MAETDDPVQGGPPGVTTDVVPTVLTRRLDDFHDCRDELGLALKNAMTALSGLGPFWGDDEHGRAFYEGTGSGKGFRAATEEIVRHVGNITTAYDRIGDNVAQAGANLETADWATVGRLAQAVDATGFAVPVTKAEVR
ncbi:hypothetical protein [Sphaerisporangium dianthi]|uniref:WXG100 family type VII secretion target n=1 Tax=Sphaerisporangium dianthi TaxID=1436120 RepID=A0ABV9C9G1_9ACTN